MKITICFWAVLEKGHASILKCGPFSEIPLALPEVFDSPYKVIFTGFWNPHHMIFAFPTTMHSQRLWDKLETLFMEVSPL